MKEYGPVDVPSGTPPEKNERIIIPIYRPGENRYYRVPDNVDNTTPSRSTQHVRFRFRTRQVSATSTVISSDVLRLAIHRPALPRFWVTCFRNMPSFVRSWICTLFPEWFLPDHVILKSERKDEEDSFDDEIRAYEHLKHAQGTLVPEFCGQVLYTGKRALLLKDVGGIPLASPEGAILKLDELSELLQECFRSLHSFGIHQLDPNPRNYHLVDGRLVALDFGQVDFDLSEDDKRYFMMTRISTILEYYRGLQLAYEHDGKLIPVDNDNECKQD
ncbi:hypothetical protein O1611_g3292 [Lasiodiplodia mahajangana]|uniref:Uncharacterized protein n=1 Tax=Lasiodiplodia mahajangana TaxID=1108764 RepID=A0ACC2JSK3_9PEZI|nr:hypothetical protein O1611_g3292 [Lasiodiplodia mahajangana]